MLILTLGHISLVLKDPFLTEGLAGYKINKDYTFLKNNFVGLYLISRRMTCFFFFSNCKFLMFICNFYVQTSTHPMHVHMSFTYLP